MTRIDLSVRQLEAFVEIVAQGGFRAASQALHLSQPALTRTIKITEQTLGARLFDRTTQGTDLTPAGRELLPIARRILEEFHASRSELAAFLQGHSGRATVAVLPSVGVSIMPALLGRFRVQHPGIRVGLPGLNAGALQDAVADGKVDFGLSIQPTAGFPLSFEPLLRDPFVLLCRKSDPLARRRAVSWSVFMDHPFIATAVGSSIRTMTDAVFAERDIAVDPLYASGNVAITAALVMEGLGITALPRLALKLINKAGLVTRPLVEPSVTRQIGIVTRKGRSISAPAELVRAALLQAAVSFGSA